LFYVLVETITNLLSYTFYIFSSLFCKIISTIKMFYHYIKYLKQKSPSNHIIVHGYYFLFIKPYHFNNLQCVHVTTKYYSWIIVCCNGFSENEESIKMHNFRQILNFWSIIFLLRILVKYFFKQFSYKKVF
jgi:hypothetical protein